MKKLFLIAAALLGLSQGLMAADLTEATIVYNPKDHHLVQQMANTFAGDISGPDSAEDHLRVIRHSHTSREGR